LSANEMSVLLQPINNKDDSKNMRLINSTSQK